MLRREDHIDSRYNAMKEEPSVLTNGSSSFYFTALSRISKVNSSSIARLPKSEKKLAERYCISKSSRFTLTPIASAESPSAVVVTFAGKEIDFVLFLIVRLPVMIGLPLLLSTLLMTNLLLG